MIQPVLRHRDRQPSAWKNGGGITWPIAGFPEGAALDAFDWRISIAQVDAAGPFSRFEGVDRVLAVIDGALTLTIDDRLPVRLDASEPDFAFAGEAEVWGAPGQGAALVLNVMVRRGTWHAAVRRLGAGCRLAVPAPDAIAFAVGADRSVLRFDAAEVVLESGDALQLGEPGQVASGAILEVVLHDGSA